MLSNTLDLFNKIATGVIASLIVLFVIVKAVDLVYPTGAIPEAAAPATPASTPSPVASAPQAAAPPSAAPAPAAAPVDEEKDLPLATLLASAKIEDGQKSAKICATCHNFAKGAGAKVGPDLYGVVGRSVASEPNFAYSDALKGKAGTWTFERLNEWIKDPKAFAPGNKMAFAGIRNQRQRANVIAYLASLSDNPVPLPGK